MTWSLVRELLFKLDPEQAHGLALKLVRPFNNPMLSGLAAQVLSTASLKQKLPKNCFGLTFPNPIGIAAGLDKNIEAVGFLAALGCGSIELGSVTAEPQPGNDRPRIFRLTEKQSMINRMGFPSIGAEAFARRLEKIRAKFPKLILGVNLGKSKSTPMQDAAKDYERSFKLVAPHADYIVVNVSSPNTPGLRDLQQAAFLQGIFSTLKSANSKNKPILVKLSPDLDMTQLEEAVGAALSGGAAGIIATNTTLSRPAGTDRCAETGGLSGSPLFPLALQNVERVVKLVQGKVPVIGVGGINSPERCRQMLDAGAELIQLYSALVYQGPLLIRKLLAAL